VREMSTKVVPWGNSAGVVIPKKILKESGLQFNDELDVTAVEDGFYLKKKPKKDYGEIFKPFISTKGWKFDRDEANEG